MSHAAKNLAKAEVAPYAQEVCYGVKISEKYEGANEIQKWIIARQIFGKDVTG